MAELVQESPEALRQALAEEADRLAKVGREELYAVDFYKASSTSDDPLKRVFVNPSDSEQNPQDQFIEALFDLEQEFGEIRFEWLDKDIATGAAAIIRLNLSTGRY